jgi:hypothetical protein
MSSKSRFGKVVNELVGFNTKEVCACAVSPLQGGSLRM